VPPPSIDAQIDDGVLVSLAAVRLAVTNRLIVRSLREGRDYDEQRLRDRVTTEIRKLAAEKAKDATRISEVRATVADKPGAADSPNDFRARDGTLLDRRAAVSAGLAARLSELAGDSEVVGSIAERAHRAFLDEFAVSVARGVQAFRDPARDAPLSAMDRNAELQGLSEDLDGLLRASGDAGQRTGGPSHLG
jgi:hypothetical protein